MRKLEGRENALLETSKNIKRRRDHKRKVRRRLEFAALLLVTAFAITTSVLFVTLRVSQSELKSTNSKLEDEIEAKEGALGDARNALNRSNRARARGHIKDALRSRSEAVSPLMEAQHLIRSAAVTPDKHTKHTSLLGVEFGIGQFTLQSIILKLTGFSCDHG